jgi:hypothetical protein
VAGAFCAAFPISARGRSLADSRHTGAPLSCNLRGTAEFRERDVGGAWIVRQIRGHDLFVTPEAMEKNQALVDLLKRIADEKRATPALPRATPEDDRPLSQSAVNKS